MQRILVTGANGFIGSNLVTVLEQYNFEVFRGVRILGSNQTSHEVLLNLSDLSLIKELCLSYKFDVIVHLSAVVGWNGMLYEDMYIENVLATGLLGYVAKKMDAHFIYGSAALIHGSKSKVISDLSPIHIDTDYARTKYDAEMLLQSILSNLCILRIGGVFGENGPSHLGINKSITEASTGIPPVLYGDGASLRNYIYVDDLCTKIIKAINLQTNGTFLVAGDETLSIKDMLNTIYAEFLPGINLTKKPGLSSGSDQVIIDSKKFGLGQTFQDSLKQIKRKL